MAIYKIENGEITEVTASRQNKLEIVGGQMKYANFSGKPSKFNADGKRNFELLLPEDAAYTLADAGWRIRKNGYDEKLGKRRTGDVNDKLDDPEFRLKVNVNLDSTNPPKMFKKTSKQLVPLDSSTCGSLDYTDVSDIFVEINGYDSAHDGHYSGYLKTIVATVGDSMFDQLFGDLPIAGTADPDKDKLPFE